MSIYKFSIIDDLMSMVVNEFIKLIKIENNVDLNKFIIICIDVLFFRVIRYNKEKNKRYFIFFKNFFFNFYWKNGNWYYEFRLYILRYLCNVVIKIINKVNISKIINDVISL